jgi:hypothetical protein
VRKLFFILKLTFILSSCQKKEIESAKLEILEQNNLHQEDSSAKQMLRIEEPRDLEIEPYGFDTMLGDSFYLSYRVYNDTFENGKLQSLTLVKGKKDIKQISETSFPMLHKNLGYISADFEETFLFVQSFGSGNPHELQLILKETGEVLTKGVFVSQNEAEKILLYIKDEDMEELTLHDLKSKKEKTILDFNDLNCTRIGGLRNCVEIDTVTEKVIVLKSISGSKQEDELIKKYKR